MADKLTWKREPKAKGLASVAQGERGYYMRLNKERIGTVAPWSRNDGHYCWYASVGKERMNTACNPVATVEEARAQCMAWVKQQLKNGAQSNA